MGRGYWLPPRAKELAACDGFYIDSDAVYTSGNTTADWNSFLNTLCKQLTFHERTFEQLCEWKPCDAGQSRFVVLQNRHADIVMEDCEDYVAVFLLIPEDCAAPGFAKRSFPRYLNILQNCLTELYPGSISKRLNSQHIQAVG